MQKIYKLTPSLKDYLWGGNKLTNYGKKTDGDVIAESWELSFTKGGEARANGLYLPDMFPKSTWGKRAEEFDFFPVLTKFIDAKDKLSVQVHPSDEYALKNESSYGKTEMWYVVEADEGAGIYLGFKRACQENEVREAIANGTVEELLSFVPAKAGDVFFIPAGTVHAIGAGMVIYEIQQNSNLTYRLYDYMRRDKTGALRELHVDKAMSVINFDVYKAASNDSADASVIGECKYFKASKYKLNFTKQDFFVDYNSFFAVTCIAGEGEISGEYISQGDTYFAPAGAGKIELSTAGEIEFITVSL